MSKTKRKVNIKSILLWAAAIVFYYCWFQALYNSLQYDSVYPYPDFKIAINVILSNFITISIVFLLNLLIVSRPLRKTQMKLKVIIDFILSFLGVTVINYIYILFVNNNVDWTGTFLNNIIIFLWVEVVYYFRNYNKSRLEAEEAAKKAMQYRYDALKSQINPHFLFNSLNLLSSIVSVEPEKAKKFILGLASMYRYILSCEGKETIKVSEELEFLASYVEVLEMRYNNKFNVEFIGSPKEDAIIVPYTLQLLIENVTKHNVISTKYPMVVTIKMTEKGVTVSNPIQMRQNSVSGGIGLRYLSELYGLYGERFSTKVEDDVFIAEVPYISSLLDKNI